MKPTDSRTRRLCHSVVLLLCGLAIGGAQADDAVSLVNATRSNWGWHFDNGPEFPGATGQISIDPTVQHAGQPSLKLAADFTKGGRYVQASTDIATIDPDEISFWVKGWERDRLTLRIVDGSGQCHQLGIRTLANPDWQKITFSVSKFFANHRVSEGVARYENWGGAKDGKWHRPAKLLAWVVNARPDSPTPQLWISAPKIYPAAAPVAEPAATTAAATGPAGKLVVVRLDEFPGGELDWDYIPGQEFPGAKGTLTLVKDQPQAGQSALKLAANFTKGMYVAAGKDLPTDGLETPAIKYQIKTDNAIKYGLRVIDSTGQCFQKQGLPLTPDGQWHEAVIEPPKLAGSEHWGGAKDGQWHGPASAIYLMLNKGSDPDKKQPAILVADIRAEVVLGQAVQVAAYNEGFEKLPALPSSWKVAGTVMLDPAVAFKGTTCLTLTRTQADMDRQPTAVRLDSFPAKPGTWELKAALRSSLYSPDSSYNGSIVLEAVDGADKVVQSFELGIITGTNSWQPFTKRVELPSGSVAARFTATLNKTYGKFSIDELSAAAVATTRRAQANVTALKFSAAAINSNVLGHLFLPADKVQLQVSAESVRPLPESAGEVSCVLKDYWGAELTASLKVALEKSTKVSKNKFVAKGTLDLSAVKLELGKYYEVHGEILDPSLGESYRNYSSFAILPLAVTKQYQPFDIPFTSRNWDNRIRECFFLTDRIGVRVCGVWSRWKAQPPYVVSAPGIDICKQLGMGALLGTPGNAVERRVKHYQDYDETAWREGAKNLINQYKNELPIAIYLGNEPHASDDAQAQEMVAAYKAMYDGAKAADSNVVVIGTSSGPEEIFFKNGFQSWQDVYDFHVYEDAKAVRSAFARYRELFAKYPHSAKPIWSTEIGLNSQGLTRQTITIDLIKKFAYFFAEGGGNLSWFDLLYPDPAGTALGSNAESFNVFDCRYNLYAPKLDAIAYYNMVNGICVKKFAAEKQYNGDIHAFLFRDPDRHCLQILWKDKGQQAALVPLPGTGPVKVLRLDGSSAQLNAQNTGLTLNISEEPLLLLYDSPLAQLPAQLGPPTLALAAEPAPVIKGGSITLMLTGAVAGTVSAPPFWSVKPTAPNTWTLTAPEKTTAREGRIVVALPDGSGELAFPVVVTGLLEMRLLATPLTGTNTAGVKLLVKNNGREKQTVTTHLAVVSEFSMTNGTFKLKASEPPQAYVADSAATTIDLDGRQEQSVAVPLAGLKPQTLYRVKASITDAAGRTVQRERFVSGFVNVPRASTPIKLDGALAEADWQKSSVLSINDARQFFSYAKPPHQWPGRSGLSGEMRLLWDNQYLYVGVKVTDRVFRNTKQDAEIWSGDGLQFLIDPARASTDKIGKYDYAMAIGSKGPQVWSYYVADSAVPLGEVKAIQFIGKPAGDGTGGMTYEIAIPWSHLAPFQPVVGGNLGLALILNDDDGQGRDEFIGWFSGCHTKEVDMVGDLILGE